MRVVNHKDEILSRFARAYAKTEQSYDDACRDAITTPRDWPEGFGVTHRRNGSIVSGSHRDIVDLGELRDSQSYQRTDEYKTEYSWSAGHALYVHEGYTAKSGRPITARRWTEVAAEESH